MNQGRMNQHRHGNLSKVNLPLQDSSATVAAQWAITPLKRVMMPREFGAKAFRLAEMLRRGYRVPDAMVIGGTVFTRFLKDSQLEAFIQSRVHSLSIHDIAQVARVSKEIEQQLLATSLPDELIESLLTACAPLLKHGPVAVRSSACGEDARDAAFAGQLDSFLNVKTAEQLLDALPRCWASYWSHRSLTYQLARGVRLDAMGVIVQQQVDAEFSGVLFTRNVEDPSADQSVIEFCRGLGERLVSGEICPARVVFRANEDWTQSAGDQETRLSDALLRELANRGRKLERDFEHPQDVEWSVDRSGRLHLVQSRPITTISLPARMMVWSNANVNENFPDPISPLLYSVASLGYYHYFRNLAIAFGISNDRIEAMEYPLRNLIGTHAGRMYYNLSNIHAVLRAAPLGEFLAEAFNQFVGSESTTRDVQRPTWNSVRRGRLRELRELVTIARRATKRLRAMQQRVTVFESTVDDFAKDSQPNRLDDLDRQELLALWRRFVAIRSQWTDAAMADASSMIYYQLTRRLLASESADDAERAVVNRLLSGLCDIVSGLPTERLWELSRVIRQHGDLVDDLAQLDCQEVWQRIRTDDSLRDVRDELNSFLDQWGFRCSGELMLTRASYQEHPETLLPLLATYVKREGQSPREHLAQQQSLREQETDRVIDQLRGKKLARFLPWPRKDRVARRLLRSTQESVGCRERARLKQALLYSRFRRLALAIGTQWMTQGLLQEVEDIFFLTYQETDDLLSGVCMMPSTMGDVAALRRRELAEMAEHTPPDRLELPEGQYWRATNDDTSVTHDSNSNSWNQGVGVSGGTIVGRAVVLTDPSQFDQVLEGDVLVTRQTDPGWGPILFLVRGLVMERGGMLSHGAILAREYGIPTAVGIHDATRNITSGDEIRVDGDRGFVEILSR